MLRVGDEFAGHQLVSELDPGMLRTFLARQLGDTDTLVWLHVREQVDLERSVFVSELEHLVRLPEQVPDIHTVLYGDVSGGIAWAASPYLADARRLMETVDGAESGPTVIRRVIELGERLSRCYDLGWVHATLGPERVLVTPGDGHVITHFGLARLFDLGRREVSRSPRYAAPELLKEGAINQRTDVYGLGTVLYELVCRRQMYAGHDNLVVSALTRPPEVPIATPTALREIIAKALAKDPRDRYPSVEHLVAHLHAIVAGWAVPRSRSDIGSALPLGMPRSSPPVMDMASTTTGDAIEETRTFSTPLPKASGAMPQRNAPITDVDELPHAPGMKLPVVGSTPRGRSDVPVTESAPAATPGGLAAAGSTRGRSTSPWMTPWGLAVTVLMFALLGLSGAGIRARQRRPVELAAGLTHLVHGIATPAARRAGIAPHTPPAVESLAAPLRLEREPVPSRRSDVAHKASRTAGPVLDGLYCEERYPCEHEAW
ncbi:MULTISPECIES: serine/threonine protein kinase [Sorangium]|uniref:serine/threonine protein kinase n=1 Tax=Sorangium TaxID=39643 RepID=UPI003D9C30E7